MKGKHTDTEDDCDGNSTPIFIQSAPTPVVQAQHKRLVHSSCDGLNIPRKSKTYKKNRNSNKSPSKSQPKKSHGSSKKNKKQKTKKTKKPVLASSSSPSDNSDSGSEDETVNSVDQVLFSSIRKKYESP